MQENVELPASHAQRRVREPQSDRGPPRPFRIAHNKQLARAIRCGARKPRHVVVAANNAVHDHDISRLQLDGGIDKIHHLSIDAILQAGFPQKFLRNFLVRWRQLDARRAGRPGFQQLDLDGPDASTDFEHCPVLEAMSLDKLDDPSRRRIETLAPVAFRFTERGPLAEHPAVALRRTAVAHQSIIPPPRIAPRRERAFQTDISHAWRKTREIPLAQTPVLIQTCGIAPNNFSAASHAAPRAVPATGATLSAWTCLESWSGVSAFSSPL